MISAELLKFINDELAYLSSLNSAEYNKDVEKRVYAQAVKLGEEVGELNEAVLARFGNQARSKNGKIYSVEDEIADVIIVLLILAKHLDIDVSEALNSKVKTVIKRRNSKV